MAGTEVLGSATHGRSNQEPGWNKPRRRVPWWVTPTALLAVAVLLGSAAAALQHPTIAEREWSAINLSFGPNPISQSLVVSFARVSYIDQPTEFNTTGLTGAYVVQNSSWESNSSGYGILQFNDTASKNAVSHWNLGSYLGANVSYAFVDQRVALNGTTGSWSLLLSESNVTTTMPTSGGVLAGSAGPTQQAVWLTATAHTTGYSFSVSDYEQNSKGYQNVTTVAFPNTANQSALAFFDVYLYVQKASTVVSIVDTTNAKVVASETIHPVLGSNLTKLGFLTDILTAGSGTYGAEILDETYFVDHNAFANAPTSPVMFRPLLAGSASPSASVAPFDPAADSANLTHAPDSGGSWNNVATNLASFSSVLNSSNPASMTSSQVPSKLVVNQTLNRNLTTAAANDSLATLRAAPEATGITTTADLYVSTWDPSAVAAEIHSFLTNYISAKTGIPAADVEIQGYLISSISVQTTFSSAAAKTIHDYLANAIPGFLQSSNLSLVNTTTGAIEAGADIGEFMDPVSGVIYPARVSTSWTGAQSIFDPVTGRSYASPNAAGFPAGSTIDAAGEVLVPQATFLGWSASGEPEFEYAGCFIVCAPSLSGAASAVSNFFASAAKSVSNAAGTVSSTVDNSVIKPVSGTLSNDIGTLSSDVSKAAANVLPAFGATTSTIGSAISGTLTSTLGSVGSAIASAGNGAAGALLSGVDSFSNGLVSLGSSAVSAAGAVGSAIANTAGKVVSDAQAVISPFFASVANIPAEVAGAVGTATRSLASLGSSIASAGMNALDTVGHAIENAGGSVFGALSGAWKDVTNFFGSVASGIAGALGFGGSSGSTSGDAANWFTGLAGNNSALLEVIVIAVVVGLVVLVLVAIFWWMPHRRHSGRESRGRHHERGHRASA